MPRGMLPRSFARRRTLAIRSVPRTIGRFEGARVQAMAIPVPVEDFVENGRWFQQQDVPEVDERLVERLGHKRPGFRLVLEDGEELDARRVVVGAGIGFFAWVPPELRGFNSALVSHSSAHQEFERFEVSA
jgi:hypothetical protein